MSVESSGLRGRRHLRFRPLRQCINLPVRLAGVRMLGDDGITEVRGPAAYAAICSSLHPRHSDQATAEATRWDVKRAVTTRALVEFGRIAAATRLPPDSHVMAKRSCKVTVTSRPSAILRGLACSLSFANFAALRDKRERAETCGIP